MKILFVTYGLPYPLNSGARIRDFNLISNISREHSVSLLSLLEFPKEVRYVPQLKKYCDTVDVVPIEQRSLLEHLTGIVRCMFAGRPIATHPFYFSEMAEKIGKVVERENIDIIQIEHSFFAPYVKALPVNNDCKKILSFQNIGISQYRSMLSLDMGVSKIIFLFKWLLMFQWEVKYAELFDLCLVVSHDEYQYLRSKNAKLPVAVIDNGVDTKRLQPLSESSDENTLLFVGTMGYPPNADAVIHFCNDIKPLIERKVPDVKLIIAGRYPSEEVRKLEKLKNVVVTEHVEDIVPYYQKSRVCIVPLRAGAGSRLKILEAMALGRPIVSTTIGAEGLAIQDKVNILIGDSPTEFAESVVSLMQDRSLRDTISLNARKLVTARYDWTIMSQRLIELYSDLVNKGTHEI